ncbi:PAS domain-containing sensor histidine kinase [Psychroserpens mesophilus]|uniref:PAS domain-containing sensor histidine kinase n=1 Tax=Psychroserpens mesophilus TaxID=325473 RepID=UPI003D64E61E
MEAINYYLPSGLNHTLWSKINDNSIWTLSDSLGRLEYVSNSYCELLKTHSNRLVGEPHKLLKSHLHSDVLYKNLWRTIKMGQKWNGVLSETLDNGNTLFLDATIIPIQDEIESSVKYIGLYKDVTKLHQQNKQIIISNAADKDFLNSMPFHVFLTSRHGKVINVNKPFGNKEVSELIGTYIYDYFSPDSFNKIKSNIEYVASGKVANQFEIKELDSTENTREYSILIAPVLDKLGGVISLTVTIQENTKTYCINKDREAGKKCRLIYQSINVGIIIVTDNNGKIKEWNKGAEAAFEYTASEILGKPLTVLISRKSRKSNLKELLNAAKNIENNEDAELIELNCLSKSKKEFPVELALSSLTFRVNKIYCAMMLDISKRKTLENKLKQKTKDLELFLYRSSHDLKAPFSTAVDLLNSLKKDSPTKNVKLLDLLTATMKRGELLSEGLSQASLIRVSRNKSSIIDFQKIIEDTFKLLSSENNLKGINTVKQLDTQTEFYSNSELLSTIFHNVIQNAIRYSKAPTKSKNPCITILVKTFDDKAIIEIRDTGIGIRKDHINKIFNLYFRVNNIDDSGFGLGLYVVKSIVDNLMGDIHVKSTLKKGTSFKIILPNLK